MMIYDRFFTETSNQIPLSNTVRFHLNNPSSILFHFRPNINPAISIVSVHFRWYPRVQRSGNLTVAWMQISCCLCWKVTQATRMGIFGWFNNRSICKNGSKKRIKWSKQLMDFELMDRSNGPKNPSENQNTSKPLGQKTQHGQVMQACGPTFRRPLEVETFQALDFLILFDCFSLVTKRWKMVFLVFLDP